MLSTDYSKISLFINNTVRVLTISRYAMLKYFKKPLVFFQYATMLGNLCPFYDNFEIANICRQMQTRIFCVSIGWTMLKYGSKTRSNPTKSHYINPCGFVWRLFIHGREMDNQRHTNAATRILSSYRLIHIMQISIVMGVSRSRHGFFYISSWKIPSRNGWELGVLFHESSIWLCFQTSADGIGHPSRWNMASWEIP